MQRQKMEREIDLKQISDGRLYTAGDMVKAGCGGCAGCSLCCEDMGSSIILDPYDIYHLEKATGAAFEELMADKIELNVVDGIIQPNLKMRGERKQCVFLGGDGRCTIHPYRPGFCRMFPLGRIYDENGFRYFLQIHECPYPGKTKVKLKKWLEIPELGKYEAYVKRWHYFLKDMQEIVKEAQNELIVKNLNLYLLNQFYVKAYDIACGEECGLDFYSQFDGRLQEAEKTAATYR